MIKGQITNARKAEVVLRVRSAGSQWMEVHAQIDTGFSEYLSLPISVIGNLSMPKIGAQPMDLADGSSALSDLYLGYVLWDGTERIVPVQASSENVPALIGMAILHDHRATLDVKYQGPITIEHLP